MTKDSPGAASSGPPNRPVSSNSRAASIAGSVLALAFAAFGLSQCGWVQKIWLDHEVDRLCAIDGGVHIYETVTLPKEDFGPDGTLFPQYRTHLFTAGRYGPEYVGRMADKVLVAGNPTMVRQNTMIVRKADEKVLGEVVIYGRRGGDMPGPSATSSHVCPKGPDFNLESQVFKPQEK